MIAAFEIAGLFRRDLTHFEYGSHGHTARHQSISVRFGSSLTPLFLKKRRHERLHLRIELIQPRYNVHVTEFRLLLSSNMTYDPALEIVGVGPYYDRSALSLCPSRRSVSRTHHSPRSSAAKLLLTRFGADWRLGLSSK